jgi:hypothetical protein
MANRQRGEIDALIDGRRYTLCLTLGALAELEAALGADDLVGLAERFSAGRLRATDATRVIGAALRGAGNDIDDQAVAQMRFENGAIGMAALVAELIAITFGAEPGTGPAANPAPPAAEVAG